jgi:hypothetical protein
VAGQRDRPGRPDLDLVHGGDGHGMRADQARRRGEGVLQVGETAAFAQPRAVLPHRDAAHHDQVDRSQLVQHDPPRGPGRAADGRCLAGRLVQVVRVQGEERLSFGQPGNRHVHGLAVFQCALPYRQLRGVRIGLDGRGVRPRGQPAEPLGGGFGAGEVRDAAGRAREAGDLRGAHRRPHFFAQGGLGREHVGRAAGVPVMPGCGTGHPPILPHGWSRAAGAAPPPWSCRSLGGCA